jgi:hypothetical protein
MIGEALRNGKPDENRGRKALDLKSCARVQETDKLANLQWHSKSELL